ncbi:MAG: T9SS type A sorting domain-containing protein, partial [Duncaniella sp.]|nr:T9SS type A sorting domain-containing protein [Duncaniella sp.]
TVDREIPVDEVKTMQFTSSSSALNAVTDDRLSGAMPFYDISGKSVGSYTSVDEARLSLPSGVYILKSGDQTVKVIF